MSNSKLQVLADNREAIRLAETAAWLHDMGKCADEHIINQASNKPSGYTYAYKTAYLHLLDSMLAINILGESVLLRDLIEQGLPRHVADASKPWLMRALGRCHAAAHIEKEEAERSGKPPKDDTRPSTTFGHEGPALRDLTVKLRALPLNPLAPRNDLTVKLQNAFGQALGETRRPENEVTLWDWSSVVAALYKSAIAGALLGHQPQPPDLRWRLLSVRVNRFAFLESVTRIADLEARENLLNNALEHVRILLEETFPLATRLYSGVNDDIYIVPNLPNLLEFTDTSGKPLEQIIQDEFAKGTAKGDAMLAVEGEILPVVKLDQLAWWGQSPDRDPARDEIPPIAKVLEEKFLAYPDPIKVTNWWHKPAQEVCPICCLRPMEEKQEACVHCMNRRQSRVQVWQNNPRQTIWIDEIADHNNQMALIVGKFGLDDWLSGELVQTLLVKAVENEPDDCVPKNPSPARLRRVWETTQRFWEESVGKILREHPYAENTKGAELRRARMILIPDNKTGWQEDIPYDGKLNGGVISLFWHEAKKYFVTISNLQLAAGEAQTLAQLEQRWLGREVEVSTPDEPRRQLHFKVQAAQALGEYDPFPALLTYPDRFLTFVPASDAVGLAEKICRAYENEFGKVQNRLPIFLGLVFFQRKMPLRAVMDTAWRMLETVEWRNDDGWEIQSKQTELGKVMLTLIKNGEEINYTVPVKMGDDQTNDIWYPYFFIEGDPRPRRYCFELNGHWLVHADDLRIRDKVCVRPSHFAYFYLEHTAQRFRFDGAQDVMLLGELTRIQQVWRNLKASSIKDSALRGMAALLQVKSEAWDENTTELRHLAETTLKQAGLWNQKGKSDVVTPDDVISGRFQRCLDLYLHIFKQRMKEKNS